MDYIPSPSAFEIKLISRHNLQTTESTQIIPNSQIQQLQKLLHEMPTDQTQYCN